MIVTFTKSFERSLKKSFYKDGIKQAVSDLVTSIETKTPSRGLGVKKLRDDIWEARVGLKVRVLFALLPNEIRFVLVGSHDEISNYLRRR